MNEAIFNIKSVKDYWHNLSATEEYVRENVIELLAQAPTAVHAIDHKLRELNFLECTPFEYGSSAVVHTLSSHFVLRIDKLQNEKPQIDCIIPAFYSQAIKGDKGNYQIEILPRGMQAHPNAILELYNDAERSGYFFGDAKRANVIKLVSPTKPDLSINFICDAYDDFKPLASTSKRERRKTRDMATEKSRNPYNPGITDRSRQAELLAEFAALFTETTGRAPDATRIKAPDIKPQRRRAIGRLLESLSRKIHHSLGA